MSTTATSKLDVALFYGVQHHIAVLPVCSPIGDGSKCLAGWHDHGPDQVGKVPLITEWQNKATTNEKQIREWWAKWPDANIGGLTDGTVTLDLDARHGGADSKKKLEAEHGILPLTKTHHTGGEGTHLIYANRSGRSIRGRAPITDEYPGIDLRADGNFILLPGSKHRSGGFYTVEADLPIEEAPDWLIDLCLRGQAGFNGHRNTEIEQGSIPAGHHDDWLTKRAGEYRAHGDGQATIVDKLIVDFGRLKNQDSSHPYTREDAVRIACSIAKYPAGTVGIPTSQDDKLHRTDWGNRDRFVAIHGDKVRWCEGEDAFNVWNGKYWQPGDYQVIELAIDVSKAIYQEALACQDDDERKELLKWGMTSESRQKISAMLELVKSHPRIHTFPADYDGDQWLLNVANGTINLRDGTLKTHDPADLITRIIPIEYHAEAHSEVWEKFLERIIPDATTRSFAKRAMGYSLNGTRDEQILLFCYGEQGNNGKSTLLNSVRDVLGPYAHECEPDIFMERKFGRDSKTPDEETAALHRKRFVTATELEDNETLAVNFLKRATGGEELTSNRKYAHSFKFKPEFTLWMSGNHQPRIKDKTNSIWRRMRTIPFDHVIPENERIKGFSDILACQHGEAILAWLVQGSVEYVQDGGLTASQEVLDATTAYRRSQDNEWQFLESERAFASDNDETTCTVKLLYDTYKQWCIDNNVLALGKKKFNERVAIFGYHTERVTDNKLIWRRIGVYE